MFNFKLKAYEKGIAYETGISLSQDPCLFTNKNDKLSYRGEMSCGHYVDPNNLFYYMVQNVMGGAHQIFCPYVDPKNPSKECGAEWRYEELRKMAMLDHQEKDFFEIKMSENRIFGLKDVLACKKCDYFVRKLAYTDKTICQSCLSQGIKPDIFCFTCKSEWKDPKMNKCSDKNCGKKIEFFLENMPMKVIKGVEVEKIQLCPNCETVIEHIGTKYCSIMRCPCGFKFCYICRKGDKETNFIKCSIINGGCKEVD